MCGVRHSEHVCCIRACAACARACDVRRGRAIWSGSPTARGEVRAEDGGDAVERGAVERGAGARGAGERGAVERGAGERGAGEHDADEVGGGDEPRGGRTTAPAERGAERAWEAGAGHARGGSARRARTSLKLRSKSLRERANSLPQLRSPAARAQARSVLCPADALTLACPRRHHGTHVQRR